MNYYPFHIGDYTSHTAHLDPLEDIAYRRMLDAYYMTEGPLPADVERIAKLIRMRDHAAIVRDVLNEFFVLTDDGWRHKRCDAELMRKQEKAEKARTSAEKRWHGGNDANAQTKESERIEPACERNANAFQIASEGNAPNNQEPKERERAAQRKRGTRSQAAKVPLPDDFAASDAVIAWMQREGYGEGVGVHLKAFRLKAAAHEYRYADWDKAFMEAIRADWAGARKMNGRHAVIALPSAATPDEAVLRRISEANGGESVQRLPDGRYRCGVRYYRPSGVEELSI